MINHDYREYFIMYPSYSFVIEKKDDGELIVVYSDGVLTDSLGTKSENIIGKRLDDVYGSEEISALNYQIINAFNGETCKILTFIGEKYFRGEIKPLMDKNGKITRVAGYMMDMTDLKQDQDKIGKMAMYDGLTGMPSRTSLRVDLEKAIDRANYEGNNIVLLTLGLDSFRSINDAMGHDYGDALLKVVANRIMSVAPKNSRVYRNGGDEFSIVIENMNNDEDLENLANALLEKISETVELGVDDIINHTITASIGIVIAPYEGVDDRNMMIRSDLAMYKAKNSGRNTYVRYTESMSDQAMKKLKLQNDLRESFTNGDLFLVYQPQVNAITKQVIGAEVLVRWKHKDHGIVSPALFIPLAEETGMILKIGEWILRESCRQFREWQNQGMPKIKLSVNLSAAQFNQKDLIGMIDGIIEETQMDTNYLNLEITETISMKDVDRTREILEQLRSRNITISIDDFGTGYSCLNYLKKFTVDNLKIDRSFVSDISLDDSGPKVVKWVISLAESLNMNVIAEGVETDDQLQHLLDLGCVDVQGYLFSKPLEKTDFENIMIRGIAS